MVSQIGSLSKREEGRSILAREKCTCKSLVAGGTPEDPVQRRPVAPQCQGLRARTGREAGEADCAGLWPCEGSLSDFRSKGEKH